ncbi:hypothetical protein CEP52_011614 [Fusarium oligoseptatum]|uniref:WSC domain-containing protein n=1 Tax=Fusarium oligoseptatum TaxID=2604345 RepID=A0A428T2J8_9HYPO|nr:hypothetical protein CEP52_011614 [Fusarium oligoseptatum]
MTGTASETEEMTSTTLAVSDTTTATDEMSPSEGVTTSSTAPSDIETLTESVASTGPESTIGFTSNEAVSETVTSSSVDEQPTTQQITTEIETSVEQPSLSSSTEITVTISTQAQDTTSTKSPDITFSMSQTTSSQEVAAASTTSPPPRNLKGIAAYSFVGCLGSLDGYPTFAEVATDRLMTTTKCVALAAGRRYIGVYQRSCYAADSLTGAGLIATDSCNLPCPGDAELICGGDGRRNLLRRSLPSDRLLTLYAAEDDVSISSNLPTSLSEVASGSASTLEPSLSDTSIQEASSSVDKILSSQALTSLPLKSSLVAPEAETAVPYPPSESTESIPETTEDRFPIPFPTAGPIRTMGYTQGFNYTRTAMANTVTTVVYTTVHPNNPTLLITTQIAVTLGYEPCNCDHQTYPTVEMTTIVAPCRACGPNYEHSITLAVPTAACKSVQLHEQPDSPHRIQEHHVYSEAETYTYPKPRPTQAKPANPLPFKGQGNGGDKEDSSYQDTHRKQSPAFKSSAVEPTKVYSHQPGSSKTWTNDVFPTSHTTYPEISETTHPAGFWDGPNAPVVVAEAVNLYLRSWNVVAVICILVVLLI